MHRRDLEKKLKTSLNAAAIAHEINQPLSRVILRAQMGLEAATGADREMLAALVADAEPCDRVRLSHPTPLTMRAASSARRG